MESLWGHDVLFNIIQCNTYDRPEKLKNREGGKTYETFQKHTFFSFAPCPWRVFSIAVDREFWTGFHSLFGGECEDGLLGALL